MAEAVTLELSKDCAACKANLIRITDDEHDGVFCEECGAWHENATEVSDHGAGLSTGLLTPDQVANLRAVIDRAREKARRGE